MEPATPDEVVSCVPPNVWEQIFAHVSVLQLLAIRRTCRAWRTIVDGCPALMERVVLKFPEGFVLDRDYQPGYLVPARGLALENVRISAVEPWWPEFARRLVSVRLDRCKVSLSTLVGILRMTSSLKELDLRNLRIQHRSCPSLELSLVEKLVLRSMADDMVRFLIGMFPRLKWIDLPEDTDKTLVMNVLQKYKHSLEGITIDYSDDLLRDILQLEQLTHFAAQNGLISNEDLTEIGEALPMLKSIDVKVRVGRLSFLSTMPALEVLYLQGELRNYPAIFEESTKLAKLTQLKLSYFSLKSDTLIRLLASSPHVVEIIFINCNFRDWYEVFAVLELYCQTLQRLTLDTVKVNGEESCS